jgi:phosphoglycerate kinase
LANGRREPVGANNTSRLTPAVRQESAMPKKTIDDLGDLKGKKVLVRVDFNVPLDKKTGDVKNDRRIRGALPTIRKLLGAGASVVAMSHLGRPEKATPEERKKLTMDKVAARFGELLGKPVKKAADEVVGPAVTAAVGAMKPGDVVLLENLRFDPREQKNDTAFAKAIADLGDAYVNDAFGTCHNDHDASMVAVPAAMKAAGKPRAVGLLVAKELEILDGLMSNPKRPMVAIMGGAKVSDKINFINALLAKVDKLLVGGKMTYTFLKARGVNVGATKIADEELTAAKPLLGHVGQKIVLPVDYVAAKSDDLQQTKVCEGDIPAGYEGVDIGPKTVALFKGQMKGAGTIIWNGPVGWFEQPAFAAGTKAIAEAMASSGAVTVVGGGETAEAVEQFGYDDKMTHVSTGGGAFLAYVEGKKFQSLAQIDDK